MDHKITNIADERKKTDDLKRKLDAIQNQIALYTRNGVSIPDILRDEALDALSKYSAAVFEDFPQEKRAEIESGIASYEAQMRKTYEKFFQNMPDLPAAKITYRYGIFRQFITAIRDEPDIHEKQRIYNDFCFLYTEDESAELYYEKKSGKYESAKDYDVLIYEMPLDRVFEEILKITDEILTTVTNIKDLADFTCLLSTFFELSRRIDYALDELKTE